MTHPHQRTNQVSSSTPGRAGSAPAPEHRQEQRPGLGGLGWLFLLPIACCGGPLLIAGLAAAGALVWGGLGLGLGAILGLALVVRQRRRRACCPPGPDRGWGPGGATPGSWPR